MSIPIVTLLAVLLIGAFSICSAAPWISVMDHGAVADGRTNNAAAIDRAIEAASKAGGGTVLVPAGEYLSGPIQLRSRVTLHLEAGATLKASPRREDYAPDGGRGSGESGRPGLITARDAQDVAITGRGVIDGNGQLFIQSDVWKPLGSIGSAKFTRQGEQFMDRRFGTEDGPFAAQRDRPGNLLRFFNCKNVLLSGVTIQNSPTWTIHISRCDGVKIHAVNINSFASNLRVPNDDGIDLTASSNVLISDCDIQTGDDCIALFGSQNVIVNGCTLRSRSSAVRVGYNAGATRRCVFSNLVIHDTNRGLLVNVRADNSVEDILFANIAIHTRLHTGDWWGKGEPIHISVVPLAAGGKVGAIRNIRFQNIMADSEAGIVIYGIDESRIRDISFDNVRLSIRNGPLSNSYGGNFDLRGADRDDRALFKHDIPALYAGRVDGLRVRDLEVRWDDALPDFFTHAVQCEDFTDLQIDGLRGRQAKLGGASAVISLARGRDARIRNCTAAAGAGRFLYVEDVQGGSVMHNDLAGAASAWAPEAMPLATQGNRMPGAAGR